MSIEEALVQKLKTLPPDKQQEILDFARSLGEKNGEQPPRRLLKGALRHLNIHITEDDIREARREMWRGYMSEDSD